MAKELKMIRLASFFAFLYLSLATNRPRSPHPL